jgi:hypothetical protein
MKQMMKFLVLSAFFLTLPVDTCRGQSAAAPSIDPQAAKILPSRSLKAHIRSCFSLCPSRLTKLLKKSCNSFDREGDNPSYVIVASPFKK